MTSSIPSSLRRFCQNVPLPRLVQGSYLTIRSTSRVSPPPPLLPQQQQSIKLFDSKISNAWNVPIHVIIEPSWRDDGHVEFRQYFRTTTKHDTSSSSTMTPLPGNETLEIAVQEHQILPNRIQMIINQEMNVTVPSKDRNATVPHVTIDLIPSNIICNPAILPPQQQQQQSSMMNNTQDNSDHYNNKNIASLPTTNLVMIETIDGDDRVDDGETSKWIEEVEEEDDHDEELLRRGGIDINTTTNTSMFHNINCHNYATLTIYVPEKLNLTCELLHHHHHHHHHHHTDNIHINPTSASTISNKTSKSSITIHNKMEGDITLLNTNGNIIVSKLRGHEIHLQTQNGGMIYASNVLEAQTMTLQCTSGNNGEKNYTNGRIRCKQIHASQVDITVDQRRQQQEQAPLPIPSLNIDDDICTMDEDDDEGSLVDISSMFISGPNGGATVTVHGDHKDNNNSSTSSDIEITRDNHIIQPPQKQRKRAVRIKSHHGPLKVTTNYISKPIYTNPMTEEYYPIVELGGVNGSCEVVIENCYDVVSSALPSDNDDNNEWSSCMVHVDSLAPDSVSLVTANTGNIDITLDRKTVADLRLVSLANVECINEVGALLAEEEDDAHIVNILRHVPESNNNPTIQNPVSNVEPRITVVTSAFTSRSDNAFTNSVISYVDGWVENKSSEPDSRFERRNRGPDGVGKIRLDGAHTQALNSFTTGSTTNDVETDNGKHVSRPLLAVVGTNEIYVETVSWLGAIARRYGLEESGRELGRTASRKGRALSETIH